MKQQFLTVLNRYLFVVAVGVAATGCATHAGRDGSPKPEDGREMRRAHFYGDRKYGSEAMFNPLSAVLNNGFDQIRTYPDRNVFKFDYSGAAEGSWNSIAKASELVKEYGAWNWVRYELLPL